MRQAGYRAKKRPHPWFASGSRVRPQSESRGRARFYPGLQLTVEGYTDKVASDAFNDLLSEQRAVAVRRYLINEGLPENAIVANGFGKVMPIASNDTPQGRQQNRRVEIMVSGEVIGTKLGSPNRS